MAAISKEVSRISRCAGKERFASMPLAAGGAKLSMRRNQGVRRHAYHCSECGGFHVGSSLPGSHATDFKRERERLRMQDDEMYA